MSTPSTQPIHSQHKISELIAILENIKEEHGDLPIVYWEQRWTVTFDDFDEQALWVIRKHLYFGGFKTEGSQFYKDDPVISN